MRRAARTDANHAQIVKDLRAIGCDVLSLAAVGKGVPDLLVHRSGRLWLMEVKRPAGPKGGTKGRGLTPDQQNMRLRWPVYVVTSADEAVRIVVEGA